MSEQKLIESMTFEQALAELEEIVKKIDAGQESLQSAVSSFEKGVLLKNYCEKKLTEARLKVEKITKFENGNIVTEELKQSE